MSGMSEVRVEQRQGKWDVRVWHGLQHEASYGWRIRKSAVAWGNRVHKAMAARGQQEGGAS